MNKKLAMAVAFMLIISLGACTPIKPAELTAAAESEAEADNAPTSTENLTQTEAPSTGAPAPPAPLPPIRDCLEDPGYSADCDRSYDASVVCVAFPAEDPSGYASTLNLPGEITFYLMIDTAATGEIAFADLQTGFPAFWGNLAPEEEGLHFEFNGVGPFPEHPDVEFEMFVSIHDEGSADWFISGVALVGKNETLGEGIQFITYEFECNK